MKRGDIVQDTRYGVPYEVVAVEEDVVTVEPLSGGLKTYLASAADLVVIPGLHRR